MALNLNSSTLITIFGGSGFLGRYAVNALAQTGCRIRVAVRRPELAGFVRTLGGIGQVHPIQANVRDDDSVRAAVEGADGVVNLVGILARSGKQTFRTIHVEGAARVAGAARDAGAQALVHISALGASHDSPSRYARTKAEGEDAVLAAFPSAVIFEPSIMFGPEDEFFNRFARMAQFAPLMPLIGFGKTKFQPVYVGDVAQAIVAGLNGRAKPGAIYELGGPQIYTFKELLDKIAAFTGRKRPYLPVPFFMAKLQALFLQMLPNPPLTVDQVRLLQRDNVVSEAAKADGRTIAELGITPQSVEAIVPEYLWRFREKGEFSATLL